MWKILIISVLGLASVCVGQIVQDGQCNVDIPLSNNFNIDEFLGTWYEYALSDHPLSGDCSSIEFQRVDNGITVHHKTVRQNFFQEYYGTASVVEGTARVTLTLTQMSSNPIDYWIMTTDYENYALAYGCQNISPTQRQIFIWQLGRLPYFEFEMMPVLMNNTMINNLDLDSNDLRYIDHSEQACYELPMIEAGQPVVLTGECDENIQVIQGFEAGRFLGVWHEISSYYSENALGTCGRAQYSSEDGVLVNVVNSEIINQALSTIEGTATVVSTDGSGRLSVQLEVAPGTFATSELLIIGTDYENWAVSYTCNNIGNNQRRVFSWIISRNRQLSAAAQTAVDALVGSVLDLNPQYYQASDQSNTGCFYFPEVSGQPAVFGGQCDLNIPVVQNFNAAEYLGLWHDIESYPTPFQFGTCSNAFYSLGNVGVDVFNTQVINERLDTINGVAVPVGTEGKLVVTFPILGTDLTIDSDYWIISTNYNSYALVYSCLNINEYQQQITVWKLSRSKSLAAADVTAINAAMSSISVLDQRYFSNVDQSPQGCFYYPEPTDETVIFPGSCEDVPVVPNFNVASFSGIWHEVEAYPKEFQPGECVNHNFAQSGAGISIASNSVNDQLLVTSSGQLTFTSGTDASFTLTINNDPSQTIPYHIVATDYNNYALAYSCVNQGNDFRAVYSWKLSRTKELSTASITAIDNAMTGINTLGNQYFQPIDQSDDACFYFPDLAPGEPVVLPGQCDNNIAYVTEFDAASYLGRWRLIESYPSDNQQGSCNQASYSLADDGTVVVYNTEVLNQNLLAATGVGTLALEGNQAVGKLYVTFPGATDPFELWILDTDYTSYSLVYGCENINANQRRVWSWKMSRTTSLTPQAVNAINTVINNVTVLNDRYFETIDHSDNACFYYPEMDGNAAIIFPGQCDQNIPVVMQFDPVGYMGLWHDIERYPAPFQDGTCGNAFYTLDTEQGIVDVYNTQVQNQVLDTINGYGVLDQVDQTDTSAKLLVTFEVLGFNVTTPYWVLATDYTTYALVYSCSNVNTEQRSVISWKLSRSKTLSAAANTAMTTIINTIDVLDARYYIAQDQTAQGCFYFPEPQPGVPVVFPGQCDLNLDVVPNFSLDQFQGIWHEIEAYPKDEQPGQCINHEFSLNAGGQSLNFQSSNVFAQSLGITSGTVTFTSTDGSGRLQLQFVSNGITITIPYWIVATDYQNYALAYSCVNQDSDYRGVWSWKLSRTKALSAASITSINTAIQNVDILDDRYFESISQTDESCFYLPFLAPGDPVIIPGQCDSNIVPIQNFQAERYLGFWRLIETYPTEFQVGTCGDATYSLGENGIVDVVNTEVVNQGLSTVIGTAVAAADGSGRLFVTFPGATEPAEYLILATDYETYSLVYSCSNINSEQRQVYSWKLSRSNTLPQAAVTAINAVVDNINVLNDRYYEITDRSDAACFYYPEIDGNEAVVFRGQCDQNIPVVTQFDPVGYMGLWHDVERYPAPFQDGTCGNAFYTLDTELGIVDVYNTQVQNETLDTINGYGVLDQVDETDTSAKLLVTFEVLGFNVISWKLSRSKSLSAAANTAMTTIINTIDVLDARYYIAQDQTAQGCFYFPEPQPGVPVVFPGQCDLNLDVVPNFSLDQFQGIWHEIEAYPKDEQPGQCINHEFSLNAGGQSLNFQSSNVFAQSLGITSGTVTFTSTDGSGRLQLQFVSNGITITIPYWIVATDYQNYALAYSCVNQDSDYRGVWSWKLSRTKALSAASITSINTAIQNVDILDDRYFESISQTDESCFYLPDLAPGEPVIFPGQCDSNIVPIQNFQAERYLGFWRLIETYPTEFQVGTCGDATYSLGENGIVDVVNTEVVNQGLSTVIGTAVAAADGSGRLFVTFPGATEPAEYLILATDYETYSLVYSCSNINSEQRQVYSWKLSRSNTLPQAAVTAINAVVDNINVLNDRYYEITDRSDAACFYYPEIDGNEAVVFRGQCDQNIPVVTQFDPVGYMGLWHDVERYPAPFQDGTCGNAFYTLDTELGIVDVYNTQVQNETLDTINGYGVLDQVDETDTSAKLLVTFEVLGFNVTTPYWVLATDYTTYALVYSCSNIGTEYRSVISWKLSRSKSLSAAANTAMTTIINTIDVLDARYYIAQDQTAEGCFYFPEPQPGVPVVFPGQCDLNLDVVPNFSLDQFQGIWHEIEAYPKDEQPGQCINHEFSLNAGGQSLNFQSSNVFAQSLGITSGTVTFTSTDGSGRLQLQFVSNGITITIPYWIVATDYQNYALAYSCVNQNSDYRGVWSWKLSRTKVLSAASITSINTAIQNVDILDDRYFESISQTDESCFYLPDLAPGEPVIFPGQCDANIAVVENFNAERYLGRWRLIETYPSDFQLGTCGDATYSLAPDGSVDVYNTEVINQGLSTINGSAVLATTDNRGILTVTFPDAPPIDYYIIDTDYDNYALVYSCLNINSEQRRVFSWKLSRDNTLSANSFASINAAIDNVNVLDDRYYQAVDRSDNGCFYFPEADGGVVVFRGQCDENVNVVSGFQADRYMGLWYNIESYPAQFQDGSCATASYDLDLETLVVSVVNTQVVNPGFGPVLDVQEGSAVLATTDGTAKLLVTFEVNGVNITSDYWVLATDYENYALVYSCLNLDEEYRQVISWKLGRDKTLNAASATAITAAINQVQVLDERYFEDGEQGEENCFFYPDNEGGDVLLDGQCLDDSLVPVMTNFNANQFTGVWHEVARFPSDMQQGECTSNDYTVGAQNIVTIAQSEVQDEFQTTSVISGTLAADGRGVINVDVNGVPFTSFYILDTDYSDYALVYGCRNTNPTTKQVYSWKLSRDRAGLSASANEIINELVSANVDLFEGYYDVTDQTNDACFHYPDFEELPEIIELFGPCNEGIQGVPNFDAGAYLGRWIEIERYPQRDQFGTCDRAYYSLGDDEVLVRNTQVVEQTLAEQLGSAVVASSDGTGLLNVTFVVNGITVHANYYVLATDYINYALVYSCRDLDNGNRQVSSWKLSRTTSLSAASITAMDAAIAQTQGLNQNYYQTTSQSEEDCFYIPEVDVNAAPVFRGQCEDISGVANFNAGNYAGWWHEIERFPVDNNRGECISSQYTVAGNGYQVVDTVVADGNAQIDTGTVEVSADGRLRRTVNGEVQDIYVLATDYDNFALLYSCVNVDDEYRRVWSAKHSKTRTLTQAAQNAMQAAIDANRVLYNQFYQTVDQSDAACFHYPEVSGQQVILPGQCDESIPVQQAFDVSAYGGTWYQIERYPQIHEDPSSTCIGARYILDEATGVVSVLNWEVIDGVLETIEGSATLTSTDGSAKLDVVLPVVGTEETVTTSLYVLDTDYENYSLVYSCTNINIFQRSVGVWKLSRERTMSPEGTAAITAITNQREELHDPYFIQVQQDEDCEEPSAGVLVKSSIVVMVICALWQILS